MKPTPAFAWSNECCRVMWFKPPMMGRVSHFQRCLWCLHKIISWKLFQKFKQIEICVREPLWLLWARFCSGQSEIHSNLNKMLLYHSKKSSLQFFRLASVHFLKNRLFLKVYRKIEQKVQTVPIHPCPHPMFMASSTVDIDIKVRHLLQLMNLRWHIISQSP